MSRSAEIPAMSPPTPTSVERVESDRSPSEDQRGDLVWWSLAVVSFVVATIVAYRPDLDDRSGWVLAILPWVTLLAMSAVFLHELLRLPTTVKLLATVVTIGGWAVLLFDDDRWSILTFGLYALCYSCFVSRLESGILLSAIVSAIWIAAWLNEGAPIWTVAIPTGVFVVGLVISLSIRRAVMVNLEQGELIDRLRRTQAELAAAERSKGVLEERARLAGEIHDTLAQGFASIILVSRAAQRSGDAADALPIIEQTAQSNLDAARRLVEAVRPPELDAGSLGEALDRHLSQALPPGIDGELRVVGEPRRLTGEVEVTVLRTAQEAVLNAFTHGSPSQVDVTLSYLDDAVALDVRDDGIGFVPGQVSDRGSLTGGQGLALLDDRARSLAGRLTIESTDGGGSVVSLLLPIGRV